MEDDDKQVYFTKETWAVLERLEELGFCKPRERYVLARVAIAIALARGFEASQEDMKGRDSHYQLDVLEPMKYAIRWRYPEEMRPFWRMSNLAHAGCKFLKERAQELDGNIPFIEIVTEDIETDFEPWTRIDDVSESEDQDFA